MKFKGSVIITDPCYIIKKVDESTRPKWSDFHPVEGYTDEQLKDPKEYTLFMQRTKAMEVADNNWKKSHLDDCEVCDYGENMEALGISHYLTRSTICGDWSCTTINADNGKELGQFCADAGLVSVFLLEDVLAYNPDFDYHIKRPWTTTLIKDFNGDIKLEVVPFEYVDDEYGEKVSGEEVRAIGNGNINFYTTQTGL